jgi:hypothetical protein
MKKRLWDINRQSLFPKLRTRKINFSLHNFGGQKIPQGLRYKNTGRGGGEQQALLQGCPATGQYHNFTASFSLCGSLSFPTEKPRIKIKIQEERRMGLGGWA